MSIEKMIETAIENGEIVNCMLGKGSYNTSNKMDFSPVNEVNILMAIDSIFLSETFTNIEQVVSEAICDMIHLDELSFFLSFRYCMTYLGRKKKGKLHYTLDILRISKVMSDFVNHNIIWIKGINEVPYVGYTGHLWSDLIEWNQLILDYYDYQLIKFVDNKKIRSSLAIDSLIKHNILNGKKIPHSTSQPVIHRENGNYYLSSFVFFFDKKDLEKSEVNRPSLWCVANIETGEIIDVYSSAEKEFSDASYNVKYSIKQESEYDTSKEYYEKAFSVLDEVRDELLFNGKVNIQKYSIYLEMILKNIPKEHHKFFRDLSI